MTVTSIAPPSTGLTPRELQEIERANASGRTPAVFVHGLWLLAGSWEPWRALFEETGYAVVAPGWPDDPETVAEANARPELLARKSVTQVADHMQAVVARLTKRPVLIGHSFGGLLVQMLAGRGLATATVAIDPAPFRGVLPLPISALRAASSVLLNPANRSRAVPLTLAQFRYAFANAVSEDEARTLYDTYAVPAPGLPLFQAAFANINPWTEVRVDSMNPRRGPLLIVSGQRDHTVPWAIANASYGRQRRNASPTEIVEVPGRGHSLTIDSGWREVADASLTFLGRFA